MLLITREPIKSVPSELVNEDVEDLHNTLQTINSSYTNKYRYIHSILNNYVSNNMILKVLRELSYCDLVVYDVVSNYEVTLDVCRFVINLCISESVNFLEYISETGAYLPSKFLGSVVLKGSNHTIVTLIKSYSNIIHLLLDGEIKDLLKNSLDSYLRIDIDDTALTDVSALTTSSTLMILPSTNM